MMTLLRTKDARDSITLSSPTIIFPHKSPCTDSGEHVFKRSCWPWSYKVSFNDKSLLWTGPIRGDQDSPRAGFPTATGPCPPETQLLFVLNVPLLGRDLLRTILTWEQHVQPQGPLEQTLHLQLLTLQPPNCHPICMSQGTPRKS